MRLQKRIEEALTNPTGRDPVYQAAQRLFNARTLFNLNRCNGELYKKVDTIRRRAFKRFLLGYPPRKRGDASLGDPVNWEWSVECARGGKRDVVIVSRDQDYGISMRSESHINDWLLAEFRERVSKHGQVRLTQKLLDAVAWLEQPVSEEEKEIEREILDSDAVIEHGERKPEKIHEEILREIARRFEELARRRRQEHEE